MEVRNSANPADVKRYDTESLRSGKAVISTRWSIRSDPGSTNYSFLRDMAGENQTFSDMDGVPMSLLR